MATNPLRDAVKTKYGGALKDPSGSGDAPMISPVRQKVVAQYSAPAPAVTTPDAAPTQKATQALSLRDRLAQKYAAPVKPTDATTTPAVPTPPKQDFIDKFGQTPLAKGIEGVLNKPDSTSTLENLPKAFLENLPFGIGEAVRQIQADPATAATITPGDLVKHTPGAVVDAAKGFVKAPIEGGINLVPSQIKFTIPGLGDVSNAQFNVAHRIQNGEDPVVATLSEASGAVLNTLFFASIVSKPFLPRQSVVANNTVPAENLGITDPIVPKTGRLYEKPTQTIPLTPEFLARAQSDGVVFSKNYDPKLPTYFRVSAANDGAAIKGEVVQLKPSFFSSVKSFLDGGNTGPKPTDAVVVYKLETSPAVISEAAKNPVVTAPSTLTPAPLGIKQPEPIQPVETTVQTALTSPVTPKLIEKINSMTPTEQSAFGRKIVDSINQAVGTTIDAGKAKLPENLDVIDTPSGDGRPAQYNNGKIQIFLPDLLADIRDLAAGKKITAHEGEFTTVYEKKPGESIDELATRYVRDIVLHEASHQKTFTLEDSSKIRSLQNDINVAKLARNDTALVDARQALTQYMRGVEDKANAYMRDHRAELEKEFLGGPKRATQTELQRQISKSTRGEIPRNTPSNLTEKQALKQRLAARARGAREGFSAGKKEGAAVAKEDTSSRYEKAIQKIKDRQTSIEAKRKDLIDYAQLLPFRERGKFLKSINNTKSDTEFLSVLERMRKASNTAERKVLIQNITKELKGAAIAKKGGLPSAKFAYEAQKALNQIRALQNSMTYSEAQVEIATKIAAWQTENPDGVMPIELLRQIEILKTVGIKEQTVAELSSTLDAIKSLKENGRTQKEIERFNFDTEVQQARDKIYDTVVGGKPLPSDKLSIKAREKQLGVFGKAKNFLTTQQYGLEEVLDVLSENDTTTRPYKSFLSRYVGDKVNDAFNNQNRGELKQIEDVNAMLKEAYGLEKNTEILQHIGAMKEQQSLGEFKHADGVIRRLELSKGEAMQYHMWMQDPALTETFTQTMNWTPEIMQAVEDFLSPADKKMASSLLDFYKKYYESINKEFVKEYGVDLPFNDNYSPVHRAIEVTIPENVLLAQEAAKYATAKNGSLKTRVKNTIDLKPTDAFENVTRHIVKMEHYKAWADPMRRFRRIFGDKQLRTAINDFHGPYLKVMDNFLNDFARDGVAREKVVQAIDTIRMNATKALLGLNLKVGIKQISGVLNYGIEIPTKDFFVGIADFWRDPLGHSRFLYQESPTLQERFGDGFERDIKYAIQKGYDKKLARANNLSEVMFIPIRNADKFTVYMGSWSAYRSAYNEAIRAGASEEKAMREGIRNAENITNRVQESSRLDTLSSIQRGGSWAKLLTMFQSQPSKYIRVMMNAGRNWKSGRQSGATAAKRIAWAWIITPFFYNLIADQFIDKKYRESTGGLVTRTLLGPLTYPLIVGQMFQQLYGWTQGERFAYQPTPVFAFMNDLQNAVSKFKTGDAVDATTYMLDVAGKLGGVPSTIVTKPIRNAGKKSSSSGGTPVSF